MMSGMRFFTRRVPCCGVFIYVCAPRRFHVWRGTEILRAGWSGGGAVCVVLLRGCGGGIFCSSFKNGVFLTSPKCQDCANAAELLAQRLTSAVLVRQAARGGIILAFGGSKKQPPFFQMERKIPPPQPRRRTTHTALPRTILHAKSPGGIGRRR